MIISTVVSSRFCTGGLKVRVEKWEEDIKYMNDTLDKWLEFQRNWMYLESIFGSAEIARQWPQVGAASCGANGAQWALFAGLSAPLSLLGGLPGGIGGGVVGGFFA